MKTKLLKRSNAIFLNTNSLNTIFTGLKHNASYKEIEENFLFETNLDETALRKKIKIPDHKKFEHFTTEYSSFQELFSFFNGNKKDKYIIPFLGIDS